MEALATDLEAALRETGIPPQPKRSLLDRVKGFVKDRFGDETDFVLTQEIIDNLGNSYGSTVSDPNTQA